MQQKLTTAKFRRHKNLSKFACLNFARVNLHA